MRAWELLKKINRKNTLWAGFALAPHLTCSEKLQATANAVKWFIASHKGTM